MLATSISIPVAELFQRSRRGRVLATFARSAYLDFDGSIVALVAHELMNGPLNIVLADPAPPFEQLTVGTAVTASDDGLLAAPWPIISLLGASQWDPQIRPWPPAGMPKVIANLDILAGSVLADARAEHLGHPRMEEELANLEAALWTKSPDALTAAASGLAGLGGGLTPTGDDVLVGVLAALAASPDHSTGDLVDAIANGTAGRTTRISEAYLGAAARGQASEAWQHLLAALGGDKRHSVMSAGRRILGCGETSGADMLTGFVLTMHIVSETGQFRGIEQPSKRRLSRAGF